MSPSRMTAYVTHTHCNPFHDPMPILFSWMFPSGWHQNSCLLFPILVGRLQTKSSFFIPVPVSRSSVPLKNIGENGCADCETVAFGQKFRSAFSQNYEDNFSLCKCHMTLALCMNKPQLLGNQMKNNQYAHQLKPKGNQCFSKPQAQFGYTINCKVIPNCLNWLNSAT